MSYYDPFQRYYRGQRPAQGRQSAYGQQAQDPQRRQPTLEDYHQLVSAYQELQQQQEEMAKQLATSQEALRQQTKTAIDLNEELRAAREALSTAQAQMKDLSAREEVESEWRERYVRLQAETETYRRRLEGRTAAEVAQQRNQILEDMLGLADHLEMALQHMDRLHEAQDAAVETNLRQNLEATQRAFLETLRKYGVQPMQPMGQTFDPQIHEALGHIAHAEIPEDHVAAVVRTGYWVDDQLLRPARVMVSSGVEAE